jgi:glycine hydroxymethyltransferase
MLTAEDTTAISKDRTPLELVGLVQEWIEESERWVDRESINLYAGTNIQSPATRRAMQTTLNSRPSLGDPGDKYEMGLACSDRIELLAGSVLRQLFRARFVEHRVLSGSMANLYAFMASTSPGDTIFAMPAAVAGHATHHREGAAGLYHLNVRSIPCLRGTHRIDWDGFEKEVERHRPRLVVLGTSLPLIPHDIRRVKSLAESVGSRLMYDAAHVAGIIAGGQFPNPLDEGADLMTMSTYKSFGGPAGGAVLSNDEALAERLKAIAYPGLTANFDMARVAGLAVAGLELLEFGPTYARQCIANALRLAAELAERNLPIWHPDDTDAPTHTHVLAMDARAWGGGTAAARRCEPSNVFFSGIPLPLAWDGTDYAGLRLATQEITRLGMAEDEMPMIADFVWKALTHPERSESTRQEVRTFRQRFEITKHGFA